MDSTLDEANSFDGFTPFSYLIREALGHNVHAILSSGITFDDQCKSVVRLDRKNFD